MRTTTFLVLSLVCLTAGCPAGEATEPDLSGYTNSPAFRLYFEGHTNSMVSTNVVVITTFFSDGTKAGALRHTVDQRGKILTLGQTYVPFHINPVELKKLAALLEDIPPKGTTPPLSKLVLVSRIRDGKWLTQTFDREALPKALSSVYQLLELPSFYELSGWPLKPAK